MESPYQQLENLYRHAVERLPSRQDARVLPLEHYRHAVERLPSRQDARIAQAVSQTSRYLQAAFGP